MGGAVDSSNGGSQPVHLTNRTSNANKQAPIAGAISFAEAKAALPRLPFARSPILSLSLSLSFYFLLFLFLFLFVEALRGSRGLSSCRVKFRGCSAFNRDPRLATAFRYSVAKRDRGTEEKFITTATAKQAKARGGYLAFDIFFFFFFSFYERERVSPAIE